MLSVKNHRRALSVADAGQRLLLLDSIWTKHLSENEGIAPEDRDTLRLIIDEMTSLLSNIEREAQWTRDTLASPDLDLTGVVDDALERTAELVPSEAQEKIRSEILGRDRLRRVLERAATELPQRIAADQAELAEKMQLVMDDLPSDGDISHETSCFIKGYVAGLTLGAAAATSSVAEGIFAVYQLSEIAEHC